MFSKRGKRVFLRHVANMSLLGGLIGMGLDTERKEALLKINESNEIIFNSKVRNVYSELTKSVEELVFSKDSTHLQNLVLDLNITAKKDVNVTIDINQFFSYSSSKTFNKESIKSKLGDFFSKEIDLLKNDVNSQLALETSISSDSKSETNLINGNSGEAASAPLNAMQKEIAMKRVAANNLDKARDHMENNSAFENFTTNLKKKIEQSIHGKSNIVSTDGAVFYAIRIEQGLKDIEEELLRSHIVSNTVKKMGENSELKLEQGLVSRVEAAERLALKKVTSQETFGDVARSIGDSIKSIILPILNSVLLPIVIITAIILIFFKDQILTVLKKILGFVFGPFSKLASVVVR